MTEFPYHKHPLPWKVFFRTGLWSFWLEKKRVVLNSSEGLSLTDTSLMVNSCFHRAFEFHTVLGLDRTKCSLIPNIVEWFPPRLNWMKLNYRWVLADNLNIAGGGEIIRDHAGHWVCGFSRHIGIASSSVAEVWAISDDLALASSLGFTNLVVELDALSVASLISNEFKAHPDMSSLATDPSHRTQARIQGR